MGLPVIPGDKANHIVYGAVIAAIGAIIAHKYLSLHIGEFSMLLVIACGFLKEAADWISNKLAIRAGRPPVHGVEGWDFVATVCGGLLVNVLNF